MRKVAFLIASDTFPEDRSIPPLRFTQNDAKELGEILADQETCGFETKLYLNETSQRVLADLEQISGELEPDDTLLFYYAGHGKLRRDGQLCLASKDTIAANLGATSIKARDVLAYLQESHARRRVLILDCCQSGAIGREFRGNDLQSSLTGLADSFGSYILTASTAIQFAAERERDGHGVFTKALIDCLREGGKESVTVNDWYEYAYKRLKAVANQTPLKWGIQEEGPSFEVGNFKAKQERERQCERERQERERLLEQERLERERQREREQLISTIRVRLGAYVALGELTEAHVEEAVSLLKRDEARLIPRDRRYRDDLIRFAKGEASFLEVFGAGHVHVLPPEQAPKSPGDEAYPPITPPGPAAVDQSVTPPEATFQERPIPSPEPENDDPPVMPPPKEAPPKPGEGRFAEDNQRNKSRADGANKPQTKFKGSLLLKTFPVLAVAVGIVSVLYTQFTNKSSQTTFVNQDNQLLEGPHPNALGFDLSGTAANEANQKFRDKVDKSSKLFSSRVDSICNLAVTGITKRSDVERQVTAQLNAIRSQLVEENPDVVLENINNGDIQDIVNTIVTNDNNDFKRSKCEIAVLQVTNRYSSAIMKQMDDRAKQAISKIKPG